ncbi:hypothetical protein MFLAVUS_006842 [Mucor flavus]|uniref:Alpha-1,3-glucosyltransferase n=1 Tax=Mucor flavus TaxID=439312 RepID=A0ABP9Z2M6_9FUNG
MNVSHIQNFKGRNARFVHRHRSTDFEVHRNWLAITHSLPIDQWYIEKTSEWTLDYPPFFAWFEKFLSMFAALLDPEMLKIDNLGYASAETIIFQRLTIIISELVLFWALSRYAKYFGNKYVNWVLVGSLFLHPGLIIVDHIHFQYNGLLYGILILSIVEAKRNNLLVSERHFSFQRLVVLGGSVVTVFAISFGPFIHQLPAVFGRLFPFTRGLCHAYWAPNFWALYSGADRVLIVVAKRFGWSLNEAAISSMTRGYVGDTQFAVLPTIEALHTMIITVVVQLVVLQKLWRKPTFDNFLSSLTLCAFASYLFGWHVHEKAIMIVLIPYGLMAANSKANLRALIILSAAGIVSLYPLLFQPTETPIKITLTLLWFCAVIPALAYHVQTPLKNLLSAIEVNYLYGLIFLQFYTGFVHDMMFGSGQLPFLPLMITSLYCSIGILYGWGCFMLNYLRA